tara:strand:+ start:32805 stop:33539 length:735 start_codon:yes stop_codon:yes gene_type:complete
MNVMFLDAPYNGKVELCEETLLYLSKFKKVALYASVQFVSLLDRVKEQLEEINVEWVISKASRTSIEGQLLGCNNYGLNLDKEVDCFLYVGDGKFHPLALVYGQKDIVERKEVVVNDPLQKKMFLLSVDDVSGILQKYRASLIKFMSSDTVGVIHTIKPGQEQFKASIPLENKFPNKKFYHFIDNNINFNHLEDFPFIQVWVNTACPRVGLDDQEKFRSGVVNLNDAYLAEKILSASPSIKRKV